MQGRGGRWVIRKYISGNVVERSKVWIRSEQPVRRHKVKGSTKASKADSNARQAVKVFARLLNANFGVETSLLVKLSYDNEHLPEGLEATRKDSANFLRRLKRKLKACGVSNIKTVTVCSDLDGETGEIVREHVHLVITARGIRFDDETGWCVGGEPMEAIWGRGGVWAENVRQGSDLTPLAVYLLRQTRRIPDAKKYTCSRNMTKPTVIEEEVRTGGELRAPKGAVVREKAYVPEAGINYIRYVKPAHRTQEKNAGNCESRKNAPGGKEGACGI